MYTGRGTTGRPPWLQKTLMEVHGSGYGVRFNSENRVRELQLVWYMSLGLEAT